jgi:hypothetical protein
MNDLTLVKLDQLEMIKLDPKLINFERIFINYAKSLTQLEIPKEYTLLDMIYLSYLNLSFFIIHPTWERLQVIALIGMTSLTQIVIPKDCTRINYINISKSGVKKIIIHPILQNDLHIQASGVFHTLTIHTHKKNIKYIQPSITFVFKPI